MRKYQILFKYNNSVLETLNYLKFVHLICCINKYLQFDIDLILFVKKKVTFVIINL